MMDPMQRAYMEQHQQEDRGEEALRTVRRVRLELDLLGATSDRRPLWEVVRTLVGSLRDQLKGTRAVADTWSERALNAEAALRAVTAKLSAMLDATSAISTLLQVHGYRDARAQGPEGVLWVANRTLKSLLEKKEPEITLELRVDASQVKKALAEVHAAADAAVERVRFLREVIGQR